MLQQLIEFFNGQDDKVTIYRLLRKVQFDIELEDSQFSYERYIAMSANVEDAKGNTGSIGVLKLSNLRVIWYLKSDMSSNLSFGLDSITLVDLKTIPTQIGNGIKYVLLIKAQNITNTRYQFKFIGYHIEEINIFNKINEIYKKITSTKYFRCICLSVKYENDYQVLNGEQIKNIYYQCQFIEDDKKYICKIYVTNVRIVIIKQGEKKMNYGISWIVIRNIQNNVSYQNIKGIKLYCQAQLSSKSILISCKKLSDTKKLQQQLRSFWETYAKAPIFGFSFQEDKNIKPVYEYQTEIVELESSKVKLMQRKKAYTSMDGLSSILNTQYNEELGLMVQKFPEGVSRRDLWEILK